MTSRGSQFIEMKQEREDATEEPKVRTGAHKHTQQMIKNNAIRRNEMSKLI